ncbi:MAG: hypothetical protein QOI23_2766 [Chloroflexota bacterium]|nr:hypothetical protein [Chloroflexota bacterium]
MIAGLLVWVVRKRTRGRWRAIWIAALAIWCLIWVPIALLLASPFIRFEVATIQCGHQPAIATNFAAAYSYELPGDFDYGPGIFDSAYYCSATEAEAAGFHRTTLRGG